jgi:predicted CopG family antitoxin
MASPQVTVRMSPELYKALVKMAKLEDKNLSEFTRDLIELGMSKKQVPKEQVIERLEVMEANLVGMHQVLGNVLTKSMMVCAGAKYYGQLSTTFADEMTTYITTQRALDPKVKADREQQRAEKAKQYELDYLGEVLGPQSHE